MSHNSLPIKSLDVVAFLFFEKEKLAGSTLFRHGNVCDKGNLRLSA